MQCEIDEGLWRRIARFGFNRKGQSYITKKALEEWVNRAEGRDKKFQKEQLMANKKVLLPIIQEMIDDGELQIPGR